MAGIKIPYKLPKLDDCKGDITKPWFVFYYFYNFTTNKFQRFRFYQGFPKLISKEERYAFAEKLIKSISDHLRTGFNPFQNPGYDFLRYIKHPGIYGQFQKDDVKISEYLEKVIDSRASLNRTKTVQTKKSRVKNFLQYLESKGYQEISIGRIDKLIAKDFINYLLNDLKKSNTYINSHISTLKTIFEELVDSEFITQNPFKKIKLLPQNPQGYKHFESHHIEKIKAAILKEDSQLWLFINFIVFCYIRPQEIRFLKVGDILFDTRQVIVRGEISKNKKTQTVIIPDRFFELLEDLNIKEYPPSFFIFGKGGKPSPFVYSYNYFRAKHNEIIRALGFDNSFSLYSWKHTGMIKAKLAGNDVKDIQSQARHHSLDQTTTYFKSRGFFDSEKLRKGFDL